METTFLLVLNKIISLLFFFVAGNILGKLGKVPDNLGTSISRLLYYIFLPAMMLRSMASLVTPDNIARYSACLLVGFCVLMLSIPSGLLMRKKLPGNRYEKLSAEYSMICTNSGYFGYPLILTVFGETVLSQFMVFALPFNIYAYLCVLGKYAPRQSSKFSFKDFMNPAMYATACGIVWGLLKIPFPAVLDEICSNAGSCLGPCAMIVAGSTLSHVSIKSTLGDLRVYLVIGARLVLLPLLFLAITIPLCLYCGLKDEYMLLAVVYASLPVGLNSVIFSEMYGGDSRFSAGCSFLCILSSLITLPVFFSLLTTLIEKI